MKKVISILAIISLALLTSCGVKDATNNAIETANDAGSAVIKTVDVVASGAENTVDAAAETVDVVASGAENTVDAAAETAADATPETTK